MGLLDYFQDTYAKIDTQDFACFATPASSQSIGVEVTFMKRGNVSAALTSLFCVNI